MNYNVRLMDKTKFPEAQRHVIEQRYSDALAQHLGGPEQVAAAYRTWVQAKTHQDEAPDAEISVSEKQAIQRWERAETVARLLALEGCYTGALDDLYIQVNTRATQ